MTKPEFVRILSRLFALYLLAWALTDCTYLPQYLLSLTHHWNDTNYWRNYYLLETASMVLRIAGLSLAALYFWNAGPKVTRLFMSPYTETKESAPTDSKRGVSLA